MSSFERPGSLKKPGAIGRIVRLVSGLACLYGLFALLTQGIWLVRTPLSHPAWLFLIAFGFYVFPHVVNIGFTRSWGRRPQLVIALLVIALGVLSLVQYGSFWGPPLGWFVLVWLVYIYAHLGISFLLSSIIATPGCEMRALPHLWTLITGRETAEHFCPGPLDRVDKWEASR